MNEADAVVAGERPSETSWMLAPAWAWCRVSPWLARPRLGLALALLSCALSASSLLFGFYLDDFIGRYIYSDFPGAARLFRNYSGGYGLALGDPVENHWQMEAGWAPWWHYEHLRLAMFRPIGVAVHALDFWLWPEHALPMRVHSLLWLAALVAAITRMYRAALGRLVGGAAALLFAVDHSHGFAVGHITNRHALISALFGALCLTFYARGRGASAGEAATRGASARLLQRVGGPVCYLLGLLSSESTLAILGYLFGRALFVERGAWPKRALGLAPYLVITIVWRALYQRAGYGAFGSGNYIDLGREPLLFARALAERTPILWLGQFWAPPAEWYMALEMPASLLMWLWALLIVGLCACVLWPLLRREPAARAWAFGMVGALVPAAAVLPHNRQLIFASFGAMALLAQLWRLYAREAAAPTRPARWARHGGIALVAAHLVVSPLCLPISTVAVALTAPMRDAAAAVGNEVAGRDLIFVTTPDFYTVRMVQLLKRLNGAPLPARIRAISSERAPILVRRSDASALEVRFPGGILKAKLGDDLHRDRRIPMPAGTKVQLSGFSVEVLHVTRDGRPDRARFRFDQPLEDPRFAFYRWHERRFVPFQPPALGREVVLPGADAPLGFE